MSFVAVAIGAGVAGIAGAVITSNAAQSAANTQAAAANSASGTQWAMFQQQQENQKPWLDAGKANLNQLNSEMPDLTRKFTAQDFQTDPGYQFDLQQGMNAIQASAAAKGLLGSTGTMQSLNNYAQGMASNEYGNAYNRFTQSQNQRYNMLAGLAGTGQTAAGQVNQAGQTAATNMSNNQMAAGNAQAANSIAQGNSMSNLLGTGANTWMNYSMMNKLFPSQPGGGATPVTESNFAMPANNYGGGGSGGYGLGINTNLASGLEP